MAWNDRDDGKEKGINKRVYVLMFSNIYSSDFVAFCSPPSRRRMCVCLFCSVFIWRLTKVQYCTQIWKDETMKLIGTVDER